MNIEHLTFMYRNEETFTAVFLTWWLDGEHYAVQTNVPFEDGLDKMLAAHQWCLDEFVYQIQVSQQAGRDTGTGALPMQK